MSNLRELCQGVGVPSLSVVNVVGSLIARTTKCGVYTNAGREHAVASTKVISFLVLCGCFLIVGVTEIAVALLELNMVSFVQAFVTQVTVMALVAAWFSQNRGICCVFFVFVSVCYA